MKKIVLISCASKKLLTKARAEDLYISNLFKLNVRFAKKLKPDGIFILSAKYGLLDMNDETEPYDVTLNNMLATDRKSWAKRVLKQMEKKFDLENDHFIFLAGELYRRYLLSNIKSFEIPLKNLPIGKQLQYLKKQLG